jgi:hypothetical protein
MKDLQYIQRCLDKGADCDRLSDAAYARGDYAEGHRWAKVAIAHYTAAERYSQLHDMQSE